MKHLCALTAALLLTACGSDNSQPSSGEIEAIVQTEAKRLVLAKLRDPDSAVFSDIHVSSKSGQPIACGKVNSKNGFGGMGGAERFVSNGGGLAFLEEETQAGGMDEVWSRFC